MLNIVNPCTLVVFTFTSVISVKLVESCIVNVVPLSPRTVGLVMDTDIGLPSCNEVTLLFTRVMPADVPRKSISVIYGDVVRSNIEPFNPVQPFNDIDVREVILLTSN